jgi:hypothetical protein
MLSHFGTGGFGITDAFDRCIESSGAGGPKHMIGLLFFGASEFEFHLPFRNGLFFPAKMTLRKSLRGTQPLCDAE